MEKVGAAVVITDCSCRNAVMRVSTRLTSFLGCSTQVLGVRGNVRGEHKDLEAAGQLVDALDALQDRPGVVIVNVAPRNGQKSGTNGAPFGYFRVGETLVLATTGGRTLSLVRRLRLTRTVSVLNVPDALGAMEREHHFSAEELGRLCNTQFRGFEFAPLAAAFLSRGGILPAVPTPVEAFPDARAHTVWFVDNFGNAKLTSASHETGWGKGTQIRLAKSDPLPFIPRLADVPDGKAAFTVGSSGFGAQRFHELVVNGGRAADVFGLDVGHVLPLEVVT